MKHFILVVLVFCMPLYCMNSNTWNGDHYQENSKPQSDRAIEYINSLKLQSHEQILDVGCGSGKITSYLAKRTAHGIIVGIDSSLSMIATAQKEYANADTTFQVMKAEEISFVECFDRVVSFATFHWIKDQESAFKGCAQALKPGGMLHVVTSGGTSFMQPSTAAFYKTIQEEKWKEKLLGVHIQQYLFPLSPQRAQSLLLQADLQVKEIILKEERHFLPSIEKFKEFIRAFAQGAYPFLQALSDTEQHELLTDFATSYLQLVPANKDGSINYPEDTITIVATKLP